MLLEAESGSSHPVWMTTSPIQIPRLAIIWQRKGD
jgi:hypothetical protein